MDGGRRGARLFHLTMSIAPEELLTMTPLFIYIIFNVQWCKNFIFKGWGQRGKAPIGRRRSDALRP